MKQAKLKKLLFEAKENRDKSSAELQRVLSRAVAAKKQFKTAKAEVNRARGACKSARKKYRILTKTLKKFRSAERIAIKQFQKLNKKIRKGKSALAPKRNGAKSGAGSKSTSRKAPRLQLAKVDSATAALNL